MIVATGSLRRLALVLLVALVAACGAGSLILPRPFSLSRARVDSLGTPKERLAYLPWAASEPYLVVVSKGSRELAVYRFGERVRIYPAVFGRVDGRKVFEGDRRTPSGFYRITRKRSHHRFHRFLDLDYPNGDDLESYREALKQGLVPKPADGRRPPGPGGRVGIHGTNDENMNRLGVDWTLGCVSLTNASIDDLYDLVPEGTPVLIRDDGVPFSVDVDPDGNIGGDRLISLSPNSRPPITLDRESARPRKAFA